MCSPDQQAREPRIHGRVDARNRQRYHGLGQLLGLAET
eukprot:COSAG06_NODE_50494_length_318_cov_0.894977_1_plen_37_part_10